MRSELRTGLLLARISCKASGLRPAPFVAIGDTREQRSFAALWPDVPFIEACLPTGDYSYCGARGEAIVERKSGPDLAQSCTYERKRFWAELERMSKLKHAAIVVESHPERLAYDVAWSGLRPDSVICSALAIVADFGIPVIWSGSRERAAKDTLWLLKRWHSWGIADAAREAA